MAYADVILQDGPAVYWVMDDRIGNLADLGPYGIQGGPQNPAYLTYQAGPLVPGLPGGIRFDRWGSFQALSWTPAPQLGTVFTAEAWVRRTNPLGREPQQSIVGSFNQRWSLDILQDDRLALTVPPLAGGPAVLAESQVGAVVTGPRPHHVAVTRNDQDVHLYLDGDDVTGVTDPDTPQNGGQIWLAQTPGDGGVARTQLTIAQVAVYPTALSPARIKARWDTVLPPFWLTATTVSDRQAVRVDVDNVPPGAATFTLTRTGPSGRTVGVRGAVDAPVTSSDLVLRDWEAPFGRWLTYTITFYDSNGGEIGSGETRYLLSWDECEAWLVDLARPTNSLPVVIESMQELSFELANGVHRVLNRRAPVMTTLPAWTPSTELDVLTDTLLERDQVRALLGSGYPFLLRTAPRYGVGNIYFGLTDFTEARFLTLGDAPQRSFRIAAVQVERPDPSLFVPRAVMTYQELKETWASYADLLAGVANYDELAYTFPNDPEASPVLPWLPDDI